LALALAMALELVVALELARVLELVMVPVSKLALELVMLTVRAALAILLSRGGLTASQ
jgi:hypothetical protein